ncbi:MAG: ABC transporter permease [Planctomycetes bacterium]|nr:ABC transporter permease [Planctomycetota bacterium]
MSQINLTVNPPAGDSAQSLDLASPGRSLWGDAMRRLRRDRGAMICFAIICFYVLLALTAMTYEMVSENSGGSIPTFQETCDFANYYKPPTTEKVKWWLGTDWSGKSVLFKTILGAKVSLTVGLMANLIAVPLGMLLGAIAGYFGRRIDDVITWLYSTLSSIPGIILLIAMKFAFKNVHFLGLDLSGIHGIYIALGVISWVGTCRLVRAETMKIRELDYVVAARAVGRSDMAILARHVLPNVLHIGIINFSLGFVGAVHAEVILSYLGLGVDVGVPSWGTMINGARNDLMSGYWWELASSVTAMFFLVLALNIFGDRLRDAFDPKLKNV